MAKFINSFRMICPNFPVKVFSARRSKSGFRSFVSTLIALPSSSTKFIRNSISLLSPQTRCVSNETEKVFLNIFRLDWELPFPDPGKRAKVSCFDCQTAKVFTRNPKLEDSKLKSENLKIFRVWSSKFEFNVWNSKKLAFHCNFPNDRRSG